MKNFFFLFDQRIGKIFEDVEQVVFLQFRLNFLGEEGGPRTCIQVCVCVYLRSVKKQTIESLQRIQVGVFGIYNYVHVMFRYLYNLQ